MNFKYCIVIILISIGLFFSCSKNKIITNSTAILTLSNDTVLFDTVFTTIGSVTKKFKIYNRNKGTINISKIELAGGSNSNFRLNINGLSAPLSQNIEIRENDSIFIFVEVTVDPNNSNGPMILTDSVLIESNGNLLDVDLVAWGQDAYFHSANAFVFSIDANGDTSKLTYHSICNEIWKNDKPHVVFGFAIVEPTCKLTIEEGTNIHFHKNSGLIVGNPFSTVLGATLIVNGTADNMVTFEGDRLEHPYFDEPGQWDRIWLTPTSVNNVINGAIIKNGNIGIQVDTNSNNFATPSLIINNSRSENHSGVGLLAQGAKIVANNCSFNNCGQYVTALSMGGDYEFNHCTFANYWTFGSRDKGMLLLNNYFEDVNGVIQIRALTKANFNNCIIYGSLDDEIIVDGKGTNQLNYLFDNCLLKTKLNTSSSHYNNVTVNPASIIINGITHDPVFNAFTLNNYSLFNQSTALNIGNNVLTNNLLNYLPNTNDALNIVRSDGQPDLGAFEFVP